MSIIEQEVPEVGAVELSPETRRILVEAKGLVVHGWFQNIGGDCRHVGGLPAHCVATAISEAIDQLGTCFGLADAVEALQTAAGISHTDFPAWNDAPDRTHEEVVALFDKALLG